MNRFSTNRHSFPRSTLAVAAAPLLAPAFHIGMRRPSLSQTARSSSCNKETLQRLAQAQPAFKHCHDGCIDEDENLYGCQWNAGQTYPVKPDRV